MAISVDPGGGSKKSNTTSAYQKKLKKRKLDEEAAAESQAQYDQLTQGGDNPDNKPKDTRSNLEKLKSGIKSVGSSIASSYDRVGKGVGESLAYDTKDSKDARASAQKLTEMNTQIAADLNKELKTTTDPAKKARIEKTLASISQSNEENFKRQTERNNQIIERTDPVKGAAAVGSIGFDILTAGTVGSAAKGGAKEAGMQTGKLFIKSQAQKEAEKLAAEEAAKFTAKNVAKKVAIGVGQGAGSGGMNAIQEKGKDVTLKDIAKGAAVGGATGGAITFAGAALGAGFRAGPGKYLAERKEAKLAGELADSASPNQVAPKQLPAGKIQNKSETVIGAKPAEKGTPATIPMADKEYAAEFNKISKSYDAQTKAAEKLPPLQRNIVLDDIEQKHHEMLNALNDQFDNGKPNPDFKPATPAEPGKKVETGFVMGGNTPAEDAALKVEKGQRAQLHQRIGQIDKIIADAQQNGVTHKTADDLRALMRERHDAQNVLDGNMRFDDLYGKQLDTGGPTRPLPFGESKVPQEGAPSVSKTTLPSATKPAAIATDESQNIANTGVRAKIRSVFTPIANFSDKTQAAFKANAGGRHVAEERSRQVVRQLQTAAKESGVKLDFDLARKIEAGTAPNNEFTKQFREIADKAREEANAAGFDIGYREDYVPHIWKKSEEEVDKIARGAGLKPRAEGERIIPTYEEGLKLGLKPKYKDPAEMMGDYVKNLENARTNVALVKDLQEQGLLQAGKTKSGWKAITAEGFPKDARGRNLTAPKEVARVLNNLYGQSDSLIDKALRKTAGVNSVWQDIALAGGIPYTPANFFTFSQMMKEGALGIGQTASGQPIRGAKTVYSPIAAFARSFSKEATKNFEQKHAKFLEELAARGVPIKFGESGGHWNKMFNEPTFGRFMPNLQLNTAKNIQNALEKKLGKDAALDLTAETMKKMYGITDQLATGRSQAVQDLVGTIGFAPKYRESIMNVLGHTVKSVIDPRTWGDRSYSLNRRLAVGIGATYLIYDQINRATTGHGINENPDGKELQLAIPYGGKDDKGNQKVVYIPFMPSFMTMPRAAVAAGQDLLKGDLGGVASEAGKFASMPIQTGTQVAANKDYFGRPIVNDAEAARLSGKEEDSNLTKTLKRAGYILGQGSPAIPRAIMGAAQGKPLEQNIATAGEAPVRFGTFSDKSTKQHSYSPQQVTGDFYKVYTPAYAKKTKVSKEVTQLIKEGRVNEAKRRAEEYNASLRGKFSGYLNKYGDMPSEDPKWKEMMTGLLIGTSDNSFKARARK